MFFQIQENILKSIEITHVKEGLIATGYISFDEFEKSYDSLGFSESNYTDCKIYSTNFRNSIEIYDEYTFGLVNLLNLRDVFGSRDKFAFFIKKNLFLVVNIDDADSNTAQIFETSINRFRPENATLEKIVYGFFDGIMSNDNKIMENIEINISNLEDKIQDEHIEKIFVSELIAIKKELIVIRNYYEQFVTIGEELQENENDIFSEEDLRYFKIFTDKVSRLSNNTAMLKDYTVQVREAYDALMNYNINKVMKIFTVVTTIFLPLTLIVGWYGMNFTHMPELTWAYGYPLVIIMSLAIVVICIIFFKSKNLL